MWLSICIRHLMYLCHPCDWCQVLDVFADGSEDAKTLAETAPHKEVGINWRFELLSFLASGLYNSSEGKAVLCRWMLMELQLGKPHKPKDMNVYEYPHI